MTVLIVIAAILAVLVILLFSVADVVLEYEDNKLKCAVYLYKIKIYTLKGDGTLLKKILAQPEKFPDLFSTGIELLRKYVSVKSLCLNIRIGTSDAASTAIATGGLWASVYSLIGVIAGIVPIDEHKVDIVPDYVNSVFSANGKCIIKSRVVHIIIIVVTILMKINPEKGKEE